MQVGYENAETGGAVEQSPQVCRHQSTCSVMSVIVMLHTAKLATTALQAADFMTMFVVSVCLCTRGLNCSNHPVISFKTAQRVCDAMLQIHSKQQYVRIQTECTAWGCAQQP